VARRVAMPVCGAPLARVRLRFSAVTGPTIVSSAFARPAAKVRRRGKNGHQSPVRSFRYEVSREPGPGVEAWTFAWLQGTPVGSRATIPRATNFHVLAIVPSGQGRVTVDFEPTRPRARTVVRIRPGRVHRWDDVASVAGTIVLYRPEPATGSAPGGDFTGPIRWSQRSVGLLHIAADHLRRGYEAARTETIPNAREILRAFGGSALFAVMRSERDGMCA
jgi:hypothetical protein